MAKINLEGNFFIEAEDSQGHTYILKHATEAREGSKTAKRAKVKGYYSTLGGALKGYVKHRGRQLIHDFEGEITLSKAIEILEGLEKRTAAFFESLPGEGN